MANRGKAKPKAKAFGLSDHEQTVSFVGSGNADDVQRITYFLPNAEFLEGTRKKENISAVRFLHVDLDYKEYSGEEDEQADFVIGILHEDKKRPKEVPLPSAIWETGGGCQAVWKLHEPLDIQKAEELNKALLFVPQGGPETHNADRLLRLPWTMNWLNDKKRASGREPALAWAFEPVELTKPARTYALGDFRVKVPKEAVKPSEVAVAAVEIEPLPLPEHLDDVLPSDPKWVEAITSGNNPPGTTYPSRSELLFAAVIWMLCKGMQPGHVLSIIVSPEIVISAHVLENPNLLAYGNRQVVAYNIRAMAVIEERLIYRFGCADFGAIGRRSCGRGAILR